MTPEKHIYNGLRPGEEMIWTGAPFGAKEHCDIDRFLIPVSCVFLALCTFLSVCLIFSISRSGFHLHHLPETLALLAADAAAVYAYFLRFLVKRNRKADLAYGITSHGRVLISDNSVLKTFDYECAALEKAFISEMDDYGVGTIYLTEKTWRNLFDNTGLELPFLPGGRYSALYDLLDCEKVLQMITDKRRNS